LGYPCRVAPGGCARVLTVTTPRDAAYFAGLVRELCKLPRETEWVEFKENNTESHSVGAYLSALSNAAAIEGKAHAYLLWGVRDADHALVGTRFDPHATKVGNEELESRAPAAA
jgi:ATP-dependent DNA helicase RecG